MDVDVFAHLVQPLLWDLLSDRGVVPLEVQNKSQQATLCLVAHLLSQSPLHIRWLIQGKIEASWGGRLGQ